MSGGCGCGIAGALYGRVIIAFATASQGGNLLTPMANMYVKFLIAHANTQNELF
jgi:uncharacterized protein YqgC (DUF456 family)